MSVVSSPNDKAINVLNQDNSKIESRVDRLEVNVEKITEELKSLTQNTADLAKGITGLKDVLMDKISTSTKPQWSVIISMISVGLVITSLLGTFLRFVIVDISEEMQSGRIAIEEMEKELYSLNSKVAVMQSKTDTLIPYYKPTISSE